MMRLLPVTLALAAGLGAPASAQTTRAGFTEGTPVVVVGRISSQPRDVGVTHEQKMQVAVGPEQTDYTLHMADAQVQGLSGNTIAINDLQDRQWVRAEGFVMDDPRRIRVTRVRVIRAEGDDLRGTAFSRTGFERGYIVAAQPIATRPRATRPRAARPRATRPIVTETIVVETTITEPIVTPRPVVTERIVTPRPIVTERVITQPIVTERVITQPIVTERIVTQPVVTERIVTQPVVTETIIIRPATGPLPEGTPVMVVGPITSPPKGALNENKMQVAVGPGGEDYTLHFGGAEVIGPFGQRIDEDGLDDRMWVRAEGRVMRDPRRIRVTRVEVIGRNTQEAMASGYLAPTVTASGFVAPMVGARVAGIRQAYRPVGPTLVAMPVTIVGRVSSDTGAFEATRSIQVQSGGSEWTLDVADDANVMSATGAPISAHEIHEGQWIRATGWPTGERELRVVQVRNLGPQEAYQGSPFFRASAPMGYIERVAGARGEFRPTSFSGRVVGINERTGMIAVRDASGQIHRVYTDNARILFRGQEGTLRDVRVGDMVTVTGRTVTFQ